jgi:hypothetical protein
VVSWPIGAVDIGRKRHVTNPVDQRKEVGHRGKPNCPFTKSSPPHHFGLQLVGVAEEKSFSYANLAARTNQAFPVVRILGKLSGKQHLDSAMEKIAGGRIARTEGLGPGTAAPPVQTRVLLKTTRSSGRSSRGKSRKVPSDNSPVSRLTRNRRELARSSRGSCAISLGGR